MASLNGEFRHCVRSMADRTVGVSMARAPRTEPMRRPQVPAYCDALLIESDL